MAAGAQASIDAPTGRARRSRRLREAAAGVPPDTWAMLAIAGAVIVAHLLYLLGLFDPNPMGPRSGLISAVTPGPLGGQPTIDPNNGFISQAVSHRAALDVVHLHAPWWNPYEGTGTPLAGEMQSAAFFPPTLLTLLANGQLYEHMLLEIVAGIATYLLLRRISVGRWAAAAAGIAFALNGTFAWLSHATVNPVAFLPLLLLGVELRLLRVHRAPPRRLVADRSGAGALSFYAGFPEVAYIDALLAVLWLGWRCSSVGRDRLASLLGKAAAGAACGALLAAPLIVAAIDYVSHGDLGLHAGATLGSAHLPPQILPQLVLPYAFGPIFDFAGRGLVMSSLWGSVGGYLDTSLLLFALLGIFSRGRRGLRIVLAAWIVLVFARMYGEPPLLGHVLGVLPGMSRVAFFRYATASLELAVILLAALGIDDLARAPDWRRRLLLAAGAGLVLVAAAAIGAQSLIGQLEARFSQRPYFAVAVAWGALVVIAAAACALVKSRSARIRVLSALLAIDACALFVIPELSAPRSVTVDTAPVAYLQRHLGSSRFFTLGPLAPNYGSYFGVGSLNINDLPIPSRFQRYVNARLDRVVDPTVFVGNFGGGRSWFGPSPEQELERNLAGYRAASVRYVLTPPGRRCRRVRTGSCSCSALRAPGSTRCPAPTRTSPPPQVRGVRLPDARARGSRAAPRGRSSGARPTCPRWSATIDGRGVPIRTTGGLFQAIGMPAGAHTVNFGYEPPTSSGASWDSCSDAAGCWSAAG